MTDGLDNRFSIKVFHESNKVYRQYFLFEDSADIQHKVFHHALNFLKCSELSKRDNFFDILHVQVTSLCHKLNLVKYHLRNYKRVEQKLHEQFLEDVKKPIKTGRFLIEEPELTAEFESFLFQVKATLDILAGFLNPIYRDGAPKPMRYVSTFGNQGQDVIKAIEKYLRANPAQAPRLNDLLTCLRTECVEGETYPDGSRNWFHDFIRLRDTVSHYRKSLNFAFQIDKSDKEVLVFPPRLTEQQSMMAGMEVAYYNLMIFVQDFLAWLLTPYLFDYFVSFTFAPGETPDDAPKWYIMAKGFQAFGLRAVTGPALIDWFNIQSPPVDPGFCIQLHSYYQNFLLDTSRATQNRPEVQA